VALVGMLLPLERSSEPPMTLRTGVGGGIFNNGSKVDTSVVLLLLHDHADGFVDPFVAHLDVLVPPCPLVLDIGADNGLFENGR